MDAANAISALFPCQAKQSVTKHLRMSIRAGLINGGYLRLSCALIYGIVFRYRLDTGKREMSKNTPSRRLRGCGSLILRCRARSARGSKSQRIAVSELLSDLEADYRLRAVRSLPQIICQLKPIS